MKPLSRLGIGVASILLLIATLDIDAASTSSRAKQRRRNYVAKLLRTLQLPKNIDNTLRAKQAYEEVLRRHVRELHTRRDAEDPAYKGHVKSSRNSNKRCRTRCHYKRALKNVRELDYVTLDVGKRRQRRTAMGFDRKRLSVREMVQEYDRQLRIDDRVHAINQRIQQQSQYAYKNARRTKREVFNVDTRFDIQSSRQSKFPFSSVVRLSTGCSGIVIHEKHVLTAAHCVHDGLNYVKGAKRLRVGRPRKRVKAYGLKKSTKDNNRAFKWSRVKVVHFPKEWIKSSKTDNTIIEYDYALVVLRRPIGAFVTKENARTIRKTKKTAIMKVGIAPNKDNLRMNRLHFSNFNYEDAARMHYRFCQVEEESPDLYYNYCDSSRGSSGSGIYAKIPNVAAGHDLSRKPWNFERRVIATFSGLQYVKSNDGRKEYNVGVKITPLKYTQLCYWVLKNEQKCKSGRDAIYE